MWAGGRGEGGVWLGYGHGGLCMHGGGIFLNSVFCMDTEGLTILTPQNGSHACDLSST